MELHSMENPIYITGEIKAGSGRWSNYTLDKFIAPKLSLLTECNAPDLSGSNYALKAEYLLQNFILNSVFHRRADDSDYAYLYNYLRRIQRAISAYKSARESLKQYVDDFQTSQKISVYLDSLFHFEIFLFQAAEAYELLQTFFKQKTKNIPPEAAKDFKRSCERLTTFYNFSKHTNDQIQASNYLKNGTVAVWITNEGLELYKNVRNKTEEFHWAEILDTLETLSEIALIIERLPYDRKISQTSKAE